MAQLSAHADFREHMEINERITFIFLRIYGATAHDGRN